jgi:hypothetical protein
MYLFINALEMTDFDIYILLEILNRLALSSLNLTNYKNPLYVVCILMKKIVFLYNLSNHTTPLFIPHFPSLMSSNSLLLVSKSKILYTILFIPMKFFSYIYKLSPLQILSNIYPTTVTLIFFNKAPNRELVQSLECVSYLSHSILTIA